MHQDYQQKRCTGLNSCIPVVSKVSAPKVLPVRRFWTLRRPQLHPPYPVHPATCTPSLSIQTGKVTAVESISTSDVRQHYSQTIKVVTEALTDKNSTDADQSDYSFPNLQTVRN